MFQMSPNLIDQALQRTPPLKFGPELINRNDNSLKAKRIVVNKVQRIEAFADNWLDFFSTWQQENKDQFNAIHNKLAQQNRILYEENMKLNHKLNFLVDREQKRQEIEETRNRKREQRAKAKKLPQRESITPDEFNQVMKLGNVKFKDPIGKARVAGALPARRA
jgi:hypothetical protein